jgi:hypothetical protein
MKALEFDGHVADHGQIRIPPDLAEQIPRGSVVRVIILLEGGEDESRRQLGLDRFSAAYSAEDAVYENLDNGPALRKDCSSLSPVPSDAGIEGPSRFHSLRFCAQCGSDSVQRQYELQRAVLEANCAKPLVPDRRHLVFRINCESCATHFLGNGKSPGAGRKQNLSSESLPLRCQRYS